jgi:hypothetical protein
MAVRLGLIDLQMALIYIPLFFSKSLSFFVFLLLSVRAFVRFGAAVVQQRQGSA